MNATMLDEQVLAILHWLWDASSTADPAVEARARELLLDTVGCAIASTAAPEVAALFRLGAEADPGPVRFPGVAHASSMAGFAAAFGAAACWQEACEGLSSAHGRPGLHVIPAVLGPALTQGLALGTLLDAIVAGYEIGGRLGMVCRIRPGMHVDGTWGSFGAAAAACHLAGTSPATALSALNHAACHMPFSLYWPIAAGSTARNAYVGHGAMHGAASALASRAGLGGPPGSMAEMVRLALGTDPQAFPDFPGPRRWLVQDGYLKPYPAVRHVHYPAAAAEAWRGDAGTITGITVHIYKEALTYCGNRAPATAIQAQFSLSYGTACSLAHGRLDPTAYTAASLADPLVRQLEAMVEIIPDASTGDRRGCTLEVTTGGAVWRHRVDQVPGDSGTPMTRAQVLQKFRAYAGPVIGDTQANTIASRLLDGSLSAPLDLGP